MLKFKMVLEAIDRATGPMRRAKASMAEQVRGIGAGRRAAQQSVAPARRLQTVNHALAGSFARAGSAAKRWAGKAGIGSWGDAAEKAGRGVGGLLRRMGGLATGTARWAGAAAGAAGGFALFDLFKTAGQFEQYQIMLENMEGSNAAAKKSFSWVQEYAKKTPYELADVMEAFVQLKAYGIDPMNGSLTALGDASAGMSKPLMQAVEAMADATTGEFERLKEFGIRARKEGDKVTFSWRKNGKDLTRSVRATGSEIEGALVGIFGDRFGGMMARQSQTFAGMISNLRDSWSNFLMLVAQAGIFDVVKGKLAQLLAWVEKLSKNGKLKAWAQQISNWLERAFNWAVKFITETDWTAVGEKLKAVGAIINGIATGLSNAYKWYQLIASVNAATELPFEVGAKPRASKPEIRLPWSIRLNRWMSRGNKGAAAEPVALPGFAQPRSRQAANDVSGLIRLQVEAKPGTSVRTTAIEGGNARVPLRVDLGRTMAGAA